MAIQKGLSNKIQWLFILITTFLFVFSTGAQAQTCTLTLSSGNNTQTICEGSAITNITYNTNATAASISGVAGLNVGVSGGVLTVSGTPTASGTYTVTLTTGCTGGTTTATGTITVTPINTASGASSTPTLCINTVLTNITHNTTGATGIGTATGLPGGVTAAWAGNLITISGTPNAAGTFSYSIPLTGGCGTINATGTITVTANNTAGSPSSTPTLCINNALTNITIATVRATGIGTATGLPAGVTAAWASNTITISGTPNVAGTFNYTIPLTGGCGTVNATGTITVTPANTASVASSTPTLCINTALTSITHTTSGATGIGTATGLPGGVTAAWASNTITISGTPSVAGTFSYSIPLSGGCGTVNATGTITVTANRTAGTPSSSPSICINTPLTNITIATTGATGIGTASSLPGGVTAVWSSNTITISGTPNTAGTFNYSIPLVGGCGTANASGTIIVVTNNTASAASSTPTLCVNTALTNITHTTAGATGIGTTTGLPGGVNAVWASNTITISGTPNVVGTYNYTIPLNGGCGSVSASGTIVVRPNNTISLTSTLATTSQDLCINDPITNITYSTTEATGVSSTTGLPNGVTAVFAGNAGAGTITISGTPVVSGTFNYTVTMTGGCTGGTNSASGSIIVRENTISLASGSASPSQAVCFNLSPLPTIQFNTTLATGATLSGNLPPGVTGVWNNNVLTISGTPTQAGTFNYTYNLTGGCPLGSKNDTSGTIIVNPLNTNTFSLTSAPSTTNQTLCVNTGITNITYSTLGVLSGVVSNLPPGVSYTWSLNTLTISGTPTVAGVYNFQVMTTGACSGTPNPLPSATGTIVVTETNTISLTSAIATTNQILCRNSSITPITYTTIGNTNVSVSGLPTGISASYNTTNRRLTISGASDTVGTFTYTVTMSGGCNTGAQTLSGTLVYRPIYSLSLLSGASSLNQNNLCAGSAISAINFRTTGATGAQFTGLPPGVTGVWVNDSVKISGTPTIAGTYVFRVDLTGGPCNSGTRSVSDTFGIIGNPITLSSPSSTLSQTICLGSPIVPIKYLKTAVTTGATISPAFAGLSCSIVGDTIIISGTPTSAGGPTTITLSLTGSCSGTFTSGSITRRAGYTIPNVANDSNQSICRGSALTNIVYSGITGATGAFVTGLPEGISASFTGNATSGGITISGTPTVRGTFNYRINLLGGCTGNLVGGRGTIVVTGATAVLNRKSLTVDGPEILTTTQTRCVGKPIQNIVVTTTGYTSAAVLSGFALPAGVTAAFSGNATAGTVTISGTPTAVGSFNFQVGLSIATGCTNLRDTIRGTLTVLDTIIWAKISSSTGDTVDQFTAIDTVRYKGQKGATGALFSGLPDGLIGSWSMADSTATIRGIPTVTGIFNYRVTFTGRCMTGRGNIAAGIFKVDPPAMGSSGETKTIVNTTNPTGRVSVDVGKLNNPLLLYPVPTSGLLNIRGLDSYKRAKLSIVDQSGRVFHTQTWFKGNNSDELTLNLDFCPVGIYYLHISDMDAMFMDDLRERTSLKVIRFQIQR